MANAEITLLTTTSQRVRATRSSADGSFAFEAVAPGEYVLAVRAPGFAESTQPTTIGDGPATVNVALQVAGLTEDVTVQGAMTGTASTGKTMAPQHTFNLWTAYDWPNGLGLNVGVRAQSRMFIDRNNEFTLDGYGLLNLGVRYQRGAIEYALNINNVTDTEYFASVLYDSQLYPGEPINVLGTIRVRLR